MQPLCSYPNFGQNIVSLWNMSMQPLCSYPNFGQNIVSLSNMSMQLWANHPDEICHAENCNLSTSLNTINVTDFNFFTEALLTGFYLSIA